MTGRRGRSTRPRRRLHSCANVPDVLSGVSVVGVSISGVDGDGGLVVPAECVAWCRGQDYGVSVCDDMAVVDLGWWNHRLQRYGIPVRIVGRDADGAPTEHGVGYLRRGDLRDAPDTDTPTAPGSADLGVLYRAAAWLSGHPGRDRRRCFPDVRVPSVLGRELDVVTTALGACRHAPWASIPDAAAQRRWSGWPHTPGVGPAVLSLYLWATHPTTTVTDSDSALGERGGAARGGDVVGPQLLDQHAVNSLIHLGWVEDPVASRFTWARYTRYCALLHAWAAQAEVAAELIEMWLTLRWRDRTAHTHHARTP